MHDHARHDAQRDADGLRARCTRARSRERFGVNGSIIASGGSPAMVRQDHLGLVAVRDRGPEADGKGSVGLQFASRAADYPSTVTGFQQLRPMGLHHTTTVPWTSSPGAMGEYERGRDLNVPRTHGDRVANAVVSTPTRRRRVPSGCGAGHDDPSSDRVMRCGPDPARRPAREGQRTVVGHIGSASCSSCGSAGGPSSSVDWSSRPPSSASVPRLPTRPPQLRRAATRVGGSPRCSLLRMSKP